MVSLVRRTIPGMRYEMRNYEGVSAIWESAIPEDMIRRDLLAYNPVTA